MPTMYELTRDYNKLLTYAEDGTIDPALLRDTADSIQGAIEDKAVGYVKVIKQITADANEIDSEIKRLTSRRNAYRQNADTLKQMLLNAMNETNNARLKTPLFTIYTIHSTRVVLPKDISKLPPQYLKTTLSVDKAKLKRDLQANQDIQNCQLEDNYSLGVR